MISFHNLNFSIGNMIMFRVGLVLLLVIEAMSLQQIDILAEWSMFKLKYNRTYISNAEEIYRYGVFTDNIRVIRLHNMAADKGLHSFWLKINHYADMTDDEYEMLMTGLDVNGSLPHELKTGLPTNCNISGILPKEIDWRKKKCITPVKNQGICGSCYAFSSTGSLEAHHCLKTGNLVSLSEQNIIDCTDNSKYLNKGCKGGLMDHAFKYIIDNSGIDTEKSYPYKETVGNCKFNKKDIGATVRSYRDILPRGDECQLKIAVGSMGPVSVGVDASGLLFKLYSHGVYDYFLCSSTKLNHGMLVVGYGTDSFGVDYWLLKNSWSTYWGMDGYMKMIRNKNNKCGIASLASYPVV